MPFREVDVFSRLMADRIIFLGTGIDDYIANIIQAQLLFLESTDASKDIQIYINSPGGSVYAGRHLRHHAVHPSGCRHHLHRHGCVHGSRAPLRRCCWKANGLKHSRVMIHQPSVERAVKLLTLKSPPGNPKTEEGTLRHHFPPQRPDRKEGVERLRPRLLDDCIRSQGVRHD